MFFVLTLSVPAATVSWFITLNMTDIVALTAAVATLLVYIWSIGTGSSLAKRYSQKLFRLSLFLCMYAL